MTTLFPSRPTRRQLLAGLAASASLPLVPTGVAAQAACVLTPQATAGPYYFDPALERSDIREDRQGVPLRMTFQVLDATCVPVPGARVDLWHCDATGHYSGYRGQGDAGVSTEGATFLRGTQFADGDGIATFLTVYPGWYPGRTPHLHMKVFLDTETVLTGQAYFPDEVSERIYAEASPYSSRAPHHTRNTDDGVFARSGGPQSIVGIREDAEGLAAALVLGVAT